MSAMVFDTYSTSTALDNFIDQGVSDGHIVVASAKDDCITAMSNKAKMWLANLGSKEIMNLGYR